MMERTRKIQEAFRVVEHAMLTGYRRSGDGRQVIVRRSTYVHSGRRRALISCEKKPSSPKCKEGWWLPFRLFQTMAI